MRVLVTERTVDVVDDDPAVRRSFERLLHSAGLSYVMYETAPGFLEAAPQLSAGCVLLDIRMPENGWSRGASAAQLARLFSARDCDYRARRYSDRGPGDE